MKVLFCHDGPLKKDKYNNYYGTAHNDDTFIRYYTIADELSVIIRVNEISKEEAESRLSKITISPFSVVECPNISSIKGILFSKQQAKKIIYREVNKSDYIVIRLPSFIGNLAVDAAKELNKPYLVEVVACPWDAFWNHSLKGKIIAPFMYYATKKRVKNAKHVIYVTDKFLQKRYPTNGVKIGCSDVELPSLDSSILDKRLNKIKNMQYNNPIIIGTTAAVNVLYKGQQYVIKAISKLNKEGYDFEYYLAGGGDNSYLKSVAEKYCVLDKIKFLGSLPHDKVFEYLDNIDLYIQPSKQEGLPRALVEAMSRGCPSLGSITGGIPELLNDEFIFNNGAVNEICELLKKFDKKVMVEEAKRSFEKAREYDKTELNEKRNMFFKGFIEENEVIKT